MAIQGPSPGQNEALGRLTLASPAWVAVGTQMFSIFFWISYEFVSTEF
jgi:hypothetical protein